MESELHVSSTLITPDLVTSSDGFGPGPPPPFLSHDKPAAAIKAIRIPLLNFMIVLIYFTAQIKMLYVNRRLSILKPSVSPSFEIIMIL
jgi:hypothetical protein